MNKKKGFTLAEVLISLTIIGVIAAITVPALIQRTNKQETASKLEKTYSTLSQAVRQVISENGSPKGTDGWALDGSSTYEHVKKHLNIQKDCGAGSGCMDWSSHRMSNNAPLTDICGGNKDYRSLILADGSHIAIYCSSIILYDVNGQKKPNKSSKDLFFFIVRKNGLEPYSCHALEKCGTKADDSWGEQCACRILQEHAVTF